MKNRLFLLILLLWCASGFAQEANQSLPRWSPDGTKYAVVETRKIQGVISSSIKIYRVGTTDVFDEPIDLGQIAREMLPDETLPRDLDTGLYFFDWAPDSNGYVFSSMGEKNYNLFLSPTLDGEHLYRLTQSDQADITPKWSPDGKGMVFMRGNQLYLLHDDNQFRSPKENLKPQLIPLKDLDKALFPEWAPDSQRIAFSGSREGDYDIYIYDVKTEKMTRLTETKGYREYHPVWSPDGEWLAFYSKEKGSGERFDIAIARADQKELRDCSTDQPFYLVSAGTIRVATDVLQTTLLGPSWMPSSRHLVYVKHDDINGHPIQVRGFNYDGSSQQWVRVSDPISLKTSTRLNADVQCTRTGEPRLVFQHYDLVGELPLKTVQVKDVRFLKGVSKSREDLLRGGGSQDTIPELNLTLSKSKKDLLKVVGRGGYRITAYEVVEISGRPLTEGEMLEYPLGSLLQQVSVDVTIDGENTPIREVIDVPILEETAIVPLPKDVTVRISAEVQNDEKETKKLKGKWIKRGVWFGKIEDDGYCRKPIPAFVRRDKEDCGLGPFTVHEKENVYDVKTEVYEKRGDTFDFDVRLTMVPKTLTVRLKVQAQEREAPIPNMVVSFKDKGVEKPPQTTDNKGEAIFTMTAVPARSIPVQIHESEQYKGKDFKLSLQEDGDLSTDYGSRHKEQDSVFLVTVTLEAQPKRIRVSLWDDDKPQPHPIQKAMEAEIEGQNISFNENGIASIREDWLLKNPTVTLKYKGYQYQAVTDLKESTLTLQRPFLKIPVEVTNAIGQKILKFQVEGGEKVEEPDGQTKVLIKALYDEPQELRFKVEMAGKADPVSVAKRITLVRNQVVRYGAKYQLDNDQTLKEANEPLTVKFGEIDRLVSIVFVEPEKAGLEVWRGDDLLGRTDDYGKVHPLKILEAKDLNWVLIKQEDKNQQRPRDYIYDENTYKATVYLELPQYRLVVTQPPETAAVTQPSSPSKKSPCHTYTVNLSEPLFDVHFARKISEILREQIKPPYEKDLVEVIPVQSEWVLYIGPVLIASHENKAKKYLEALEKKFPETQIIPRLEQAESRTGIGLNFQEVLNNSEKISQGEAVWEELNSKGVQLNNSNIILPVKKDSIWLIVDSGNQKTYCIIKEERQLKVYHLTEQRSVYVQVATSWGGGRRQRKSQK